MLFPLFPYFKESLHLMDIRHVWSPFVFGGCVFPFLFFASGFHDTIYCVLTTVECLHELMYVKMSLL
jgi:hypothetical protein